MNRINPNSPFPRSFYPGVEDQGAAQAICLKDGQTLEKVNLKLRDGYPTRRLLVHLKWAGNRPPGDVVVSAQADMGDNPAVRKIDEGTYEFPLVESAGYTIAAYEDLAPKRTAPGATPSDCAAPARIQVEPVKVAGADMDTKELTLTFPEPGCVAQPASAPAEGVPDSASPSPAAAPTSQ